MEIYWKRIIGIWAAALFLSFTFCIYSPIVNYLCHREEMWFSLSDIWWIPILVGFAVFLAIFGSGCLLKGKLRLIYEAMVFGVGMATYLQGNVMNLDIGVQNGAKIYWHEYHDRFILNLIFWFVIIFLPVALIIWKSKFMESLILPVSGFLTAVQAVTLIILFVSVIIKGEQEGEAGYFSDKDCYTVSSSENIIVFLLDMFDDHYFKDILQEEPELVGEFDGFTQFSNSVGTYSTTLYSILKLTIGDNFYNEEDWRDWKEHKAENRLYLDDLMDDGYDISLYTLEGAVPDRIKNCTTNYSHDKIAEMLVSDYADLGKELYKFVTNKYLPDITKPKWWMFGFEFDELQKPDTNNDVWYEDNNVFYKRLKKYGVSIGGEKKQYKFIHINGAHYPYMNDENGNPAVVDSVSALQCARGSLKMVMDYIKQLKNLRGGVYDKTSIIIMADHGYYRSGVLSSPVLLAKPKHARGKMIVSNAPVSHNDYLATVMDFAGLNNDDKYGKTIFKIHANEKRSRLFYQYYLSEEANGNYRLIEYKIDDASNDYDAFKLTDREYTVNGNEILHSKYCKTCQSELKPVIVGDDYKYRLLIHEKSENYPD